MAFASFLRSRRPTNQEIQLEQAIKPVLEGLEQRLMLSTHRHRTTLAPAERISGGQIRVGLNFTGRAAELRTMYGLDAFTTQNSSFPFFGGRGSGQNIVIIGSQPSYINPVPQGRTGNLAEFSTEQGVGGVVTVNEDPLPIANSPVGQFGPTGQENGYDTLGDEVTTSMIEWAHAMAPDALITVVECPTVNGVIDNNTLSLAIQEAVRDLQLTAFPGPIDGQLPGGVICMGVSSNGEDAATAKLFDSLFSYKYASSMSFIAPAGEFGGIPSMPADSPWVTSVGGTAWQSVNGQGGNPGGITAGPTGRIFETAYNVSGGGVSTVEPVPAFQRGLTANGKRLTTRGAIDVSMAEITPPNQGLDTFWDPTFNENAPVKHFEINSTTVSAAMFSGIVADANELRFMEGLGTVGRDLNNELYAISKSTPGAFFDITQGNNLLYQASAGYDLASGLGAPNANILVPALAGVSTQSTAASVVGDFFFANNATNLGTGNLVVPMRGSILVNVGPQFIALGDTQNTQATGTFNTVLNLASGTATATSGGTTVTTTVNASLTTDGLLVRNLNNTIAGTGTLRITAGGQSETLRVSITGRVIVSRNRTPRVSLQIATVNSRGKKVPFGTQDVFQATISQ